MEMRAFFIFLELHCKSIFPTKIFIRIRTYLNINMAAHIDFHNKSATRAIADPGAEHSTHKRTHVSVSLKATKLNTRTGAGTTKHEGENAVLSRRQVFKDAFHKPPSITHSSSWPLVKRTAVSTKIGGSRFR